MIEAKPRNSRFLIDVAYPNLLQARQELGIAFDDVEVLGWINHFVNAIQLFHLRQVDMCRVQTEFGFKFADELSLNEDSPVMLVPNSFLLNGKQALVAIGRVSGPWEQVSEDRHKLKVSWWPIITYERGGIEKQPTNQVRYIDDIMSAIIKNPYFLPAYSEFATTAPFISK